MRVARLAAWAPSVDTDMFLIQPGVGQNMEWLQTVSLPPGRYPAAAVAPLSRKNTGLPGLALTIPPQGVLEPFTSTQFVPAPVTARPLPAPLPLSAPVVAAIVAPPPVGPVGP